MSLVMRKLAFLHMQQQTRRSVTGQLISAFVFAIRIVQSLFFLKPLAISYDCKARFASDLVGNPEDRFSHNEAHVIHVPLCPLCHSFLLFSDASSQNHGRLLTIFR